MPDSAPLTEDEVKTFVKDWYDLLDVHAPTGDILPLMSDDVQFRFPEVTTHGKDSFTSWYDRIVHTFFDEVHILKSVDVTPTDEGADVEVVVNWEASVWRAPIAKSDRIKFDAGQSWKVRRSEDTGEPILTLYNVHTFTTLEGSSDLPVLPREVINKYYDTANAGDWDSWLTLFQDDVVVDEQLAGHAEGVEVFRGAIEAIKRGYSKFLMHPEHIVADGEQVAVMWHCEAANAAGEPIDAHGANYFSIKDGKIAYMRNYHDSVPFKPYTDQKLD